MGAPPIKCSRAACACFAWWWNTATLEWVCTGCARRANVDAPRTCISYKRLPPPDSFPPSDYFAETTDVLRS